MTCSVGAWVLWVGRDVCCGARGCFFSRKNFLWGLFIMMYVIGWVRVVLGSFPF